MKEVYYVTLQVSPSFSVTNPSFSLKYASNKLGVLFTTVAYSPSNPLPIPNFAHVYSDSIISDTSAWTTIRGSFIADSAYQYVVIGNFFNDSLTSYFLIDPTGSYPYSYYYIDAICVSTDSMSCETLLSIKENNERRILNIYPNPLTTSSILQLNTQVKNAEVVIYDMLGKEMLRKKMNGDRMVLEKGSLESGVYFVRVYSQERQWVEKVVVE